MDLRWRKVEEPGWLGSCSPPLGLSRGQHPFGSPPPLMPPGPCQDGTTQLKRVGDATDSQEMKSALFCKSGI